MLISFEGFTNPFNDEYITLSPITQFVLTITWIFGVTTVINPKKLAPESPINTFAGYLL